MGIAAKLVEIQKRVSYLQKKGDNSAQGYKYARAEDVLQAVNKAAAELGVAVMGSRSELVSLERGLGKSGNGILTIVRIEQTYVDVETGESATFQGLGSGSDTQDKSIMKADTAALKYLLANAFNISWGDDPEATDPETGESTGQKAPKRTRKSTGGTRADAGVVKALLERIEAAQTLEDLAPIAKDASGLDNQSKEYATVKEAYTAKKNALRQTTIPGA